MRLKNLFDRFSGRQFLENQLNGNAGAGDHRLPRPRMPSRPAYRAMWGMSSRVLGHGQGNSFSHFATSIPSTPHLLTRYSICPH
jgi:hypothetical protein